MNPAHPPTVFTFQAGLQEPITLCQAHLPPGSNQPLEKQSSITAHLPLADHRLSDPSHSSLAVHHLIPFLCSWCRIPDFNDQIYTTCSCGVSGAHDGCTIDPAEKCCNVTSSNNTGMRRMKYPERLLQTSGVRLDLVVSQSASLTPKQKGTVGDFQTFEEVDKIGGQDRFHV
ncbi:hypothetical protein ATANTOWER_020163 [Ataeniobius toweri]|uniref:Uncharacterized protein n=1 Tax=Ataeniobius toweri TaxID=208326 RepID=A0ABU7B7M6_9TELE|nr:hypothetical protein [Ataeniobius toweri]